MLIFGGLDYLRLHLSHDDNISTRKLFCYLLGAITK